MFESWWLSYPGCRRRSIQFSQAGFSNSILYLSWLAAPFKNALQWNERGFTSCNLFHRFVECLCSFQPFHFCKRLHQPFLRKGNAFFWFLRVDIFLFLKGAFERDQQLTCVRYVCPPVMPVFTIGVHHCSLDLSSQLAVHHIEWPACAVLWIFGQPGDVQKKPGPAIISRSVLIKYSPSWAFLYNPKSGSIGTTGSRRSAWRGKPFVLFDNHSIYLKNEHSFKLIFLSETGQEWPV